MPDAKKPAAEPEPKGRKRSDPRDLSPTGGSPDLVDPYDSVDTSSKQSPLGNDNDADRDAGDSILDEPPNPPREHRPRDPDNVEPTSEGFGGGVASMTTSHDLKQVAEPDLEPGGSAGSVGHAGSAGSDGRQLTTEPIGYTTDDIDPVELGLGTASLDQRDSEIFEATAEMADGDVPEFDDIDPVD